MFCVSALTLSRTSRNLSIVDFSFFSTTVFIALTDYFSWRPHKFYPYPIILFIVCKSTLFSIGCTCFFIFSTISIKSVLPDSAFFLSPPCREQSAFRPGSMTAFRPGSMTAFRLGSMTAFRQAQWTLLRKNP